jgi:hypothetical protein
MWRFFKWPGSELQVLHLRGQPRCIGVPCLPLVGRFFGKV